MKRIQPAHQMQLRVICWIPVKNFWILEKTKSFGRNMAIAENKIFAKKYTQTKKCPDLTYLSCQINPPGPARKEIQNLLFIESFWYPASQNFRIFYCVKKNSFSKCAIWTKNKILEEMLSKISEPSEIRYDGLRSRFRKVGKINEVIAKYFQYLSGRSRTVK